ncbi:YtcA family lipoprotein [Klebsiella quasipneumoniae]|uniref:YtcA family lipoprotein n=1 Tax=Klebsiella quasipneumoniae TaxID=1463165 RepID=UPI00371D32A6
MFMLSGCVTEKAPDFTLFGSFFPGWIACALFGIVATVTHGGLSFTSSSAKRFQHEYCFYTCLALAVAFIFSVGICAPIE